MTVWSWLRLTIALWLLRKTLKLTAWLLLAVLVLAAWPVTLTAAVCYLAAWLRGWPAVRLYRTAAWTLPVTVAWLGALEVRAHGWAAARQPGRAWTGSWHHLAAAHLAGRSGRWPRPGWDWPGCCGRGGPTPSPPGWAASPPPRR